MLFVMWMAWVVSWSGMAEMAAPNPQVLPDRATAMSRVL
jgi:hypothetical protein